jgi:hypothetical protein
LPLITLPPVILVPGHSPSQDAKCLSLELGHIGADLADDNEGRGHVDAVDARQVHAAHLEQPRAQIELRRVARLRALLALGRFGLAGLQRLQLRLDLGVALGQLRAAEVEGRQRLLQSKQVLASPVALQAGGDLVGAGLDAHVAQRSQCVPVALAGDDGTQDGLAAGAGHVGDDGGQLDVHLHQRLLHVLHRARLRAQDRRALAHQGAQRAHRVTGAERAAQQAVAHELLQPLAVEHVGLAPRHVLHMPRVDQQHGEAACVEQLERRDPVHAGGLHRHRVDAALDQPVGQRDRR